MLSLLGEYNAKLDNKGRVMFPKNLQNQMKGLEKQGFVVNRDVFQKCLVIYPMNEWEAISKQVNSLNRFIQKNAVFIRKFNNGATIIELDGVGRINMPNNLRNWADLNKDVIFLGNGNRIELWDRGEYEKLMNEDIDFGALSEEVMGNTNQNTEL